MSLERGVDPRKVKRPYEAQFLLERGGPSYVVDDMVGFRYHSHDGAMLQVVARRGIPILVKRFWDNEEAVRKFMEQRIDDPDSIGVPVFKLGISPKRNGLYVGKYELKLLSKGGSAMGFEVSSPEDLVVKPHDFPDFSDPIKGMSQHIWYAHQKKR